MRGFRWFVPCWSGDFRLDADPKDEGRCVLTVVDPTPADREKLAVFLAEAREKGWIDPTEGIQAMGKTVMVVAAPWLTAGPVLAAQTLPEGEKWTALRAQNGLVTLENGTGEGLLERLKKGFIRFSNGLGELLTIESPAELSAAATVLAPARGCPAPLAANRRASEVLATFSSQRQMRDYLDTGAMVAFGNVTGRPYRIYHRNAAKQLGLAHCIIEVDTGRDLCAWDDRVPAEEETLGLKLAVERREGWLRDLSYGAAA